MCCLLLEIKCVVEVGQGYLFIFFFWTKLLVNCKETCLKIFRFEWKHEIFNACFLDSMCMLQWIRMKERDCVCMTAQ